jgi:hypothetical protein
MYLIEIWLTSMTLSQFMEPFYWWVCPSLRQKVFFNYIIEYLLISVFFTVVKESTQEHV